MIECKSLVAHYGNNQKGINNLTTTLSDGKVYGLLGKNGAGKTTLIRLITGLLFPKSGSCQVHGFSSYERNPVMLSNIGLVPEEVVLPSISPEAYRANWSRFYPHFDGKLMDTLLADWEFPHTKSLGKLSQGERKKFQVAFTLATRSQLILMDEPTNGLDIPSKISFRRIINEYREAGEKDLATKPLIIISTHQIKDVEELLEGVIIIDQGRHYGTYSLSEINQCFEIVPLNKGKGEKLYSFENQEGAQVVQERLATKDGKMGSQKIDLEYFYTAFLQNPEKIQEILGSKA